MSDDYEVGYKRPPVHSRFKAGQSGNPRGRPKKVKEPDNRSALERAVMTKVQIRVGEAVETVTAEEALLQSVMVHGIKGGPADRKIALSALEKAGRLTAAEPADAKRPTGNLVVPTPLSEEEWDKRFAKPKPDSVES